MSKEVIITKYSGEKEPFRDNKLRHSLKKSGASDEVIDRIIQEVKDFLYDGITTKEIYKKAFKLLRKSDGSFAARYKLKEALLELGPTGYPFENFVGEILKYQGYEVAVGSIVKGHCIDHEVDVVAVKDKEQLMIECKFHQDRGRQCDVKDPLYINSRFFDILKQWRKKDRDGSKHYEGWLVTNTRFTVDAKQYGSCAGLTLIGWSHPKQGSLKDRIDISGLYPVTALTTITKHEKQLLLNKEKVLCRDICEHPKLLFTIGISEKRHSKILKEAHELCQAVS